MVLSTVCNPEQDESMNDPSVFPTLGNASIP